MKTITTGQIIEGMNVRRYSGQGGEFSRVSRVDESGFGMMVVFVDGPTGVYGFNDDWQVDDEPVEVIAPWGYQGDEAAAWVAGYEAAMERVAERQAASS